MLYFIIGVIISLLLIWSVINNKPRFFFAIIDNSVLFIVLLVFDWKVFLIMFVWGCWNYGQGTVFERHGIE